MLKTKYQLSFFNSRGKPVLSLKVKGWHILLPPLVLLGMLVGNILLFQCYENYNNNLRNIRETDKILLEQNESLLTSASMINSIEHSLRRTVDFDAKLRIMLNIENDGDRNATLATLAEDTHGTHRLPALYQKNLNRMLWQRLDDIESKMISEEIQQQLISHAISQQLESLATIPVIMPTQGRFSSPFGFRKDPFTGQKRFHKGIDITARTGTPIRATANGIVTTATRSPSYGLVIMVTHSNSLKTRYAHMSGFAVKEGQRVLRGQLIGYVGNTGRSKAPHLHYEVHVKGKPVNPRNYILH